MEDRLPRKLAAILYADVAGYSRLTGEDEDATHRRLSEYLDLISATVENHRGRVMHYAGDAVLAMFDAVVDAVSCATEIQDKLRERNQELPNGRKVQFRIGVNSGDVIEDRGDIYGDGVNVAARLESLADPGGICISDAVRSAIGKKLDLDYEDLGEQKVKNIAEPVRAHRVLSKSAKTEMHSAPGGSTAPELPEKPSIAVLPFENMSADPEQEFFADGIAEDLLTKLTSILGLFVIARNSSFRYKGKAVDVRRVAEELGVRYVLEGSVRKAANRLRVTAQLIEAATGSHLWAEVYDRDLTDVFAVQDDITANVVKALQVTLLAGEQARIWHRSTDNLEAWSCLTRAKASHSAFTMEENRVGIELLERAVELDPNYASAWASLGWLLAHEVSFFWTDQPTDVMTRVAECAHKALALDKDLAEAHMLLGYYYLLEGDYDQAIATAERGVALGPNNADVVALLALVLNWVGRPEEALMWIEKAMRFSPVYSPWFLRAKAHALRLLGRFEEAVETYRAVVSRTPEYLPARVGLTACYAQMRRKADAQESARKLLELEPRFSIERYIRTPEYKDRTLTERIARALRDAGLPELGYEDFGEQEVKNIAEPVRAHRVLSKLAKTEMHSAAGGTSAPALPEKPSIAVLPFENMSADPEQEFFADGIAEDLLTKLTSILGLFVIARNSSFRYKGKAVDVRRVAEELGVRYVLEGSVRKAANRVRVTAQLIEAATGSHLWAEHYDRDLTDVFAVQDDITTNVVRALQVTLLEGEQARIWHRSTDNLEAWSCLTRAKAHYTDFAMEENRAGIALLERAVELDPNYASAWSWLGWLLAHEVRFLWTDDPIGILARLAECADKALTLDEDLAEAYMLLAFTHLLKGEHDKAIATAERGVALGPSNAEVVALLAFNLNWVGRPEEALAWLEKAMRFSPFYPAWFVVVKAHALRLLGRFDEAAEAYRAVISETPANLAPRIGLTVCYADMGRKADAQEGARKLLELVPKFSIERYIHIPGYKDRALNEHTAEALREAGLPE